MRELNVTQKYACAYTVEDSWFYIIKTRCLSGWLSDGDTNLLCTLQQSTNETYFPSGFLISKGSYGSF